ncbi:MAG TPA: DUF362 domain-containing protein [Candidatus Polarisedimenticolia bacterium]|nr:DUF362 domain-containing protein [Candidatus Polarisedimenticolia bacterium]
MTIPPLPASVAISDTRAAGYPAEPPFDPPERYPELPSDLWHLDPDNVVYAGVRRALMLLGLDAGRFGTPAWNPLGEIILPGDRVVVKPNLVRHFHGDGRSLESLVTHGSVTRAVLDYVVIALQGKGEIVVGDSPLQYADLASALAASGTDRVLKEVSSYAGVPLRAVDFRKERSEKRGGVIVSRVANAGDPEGYRVVDLHEASRFSGLDESRMRRFRVTQYHPATMRNAHGPGRHAYLFPATVLRSDVVINLPKLKTHRKAGVTACMKNLVGVNGSKDWLPHHAAGAPPAGDEYLRPSVRKKLMSSLRDRIEGLRSPLLRRSLKAVDRAVRATGRIRPFPDPYWEGSWHGNDTLWRMVHDLHRVLFHADATGVLRPEPVRRYFALVDAVVAGEGEGPMRPSPRPTGLLLAGFNPVAVDLVCCRLMGFDERKVPLVREALGREGIPGLVSAADVRLATNEPRWEALFELTRPGTLEFRPPAGWAGAIELLP